MKRYSEYLDTIKEEKMNNDAIYDAILERKENLEVLESWLEKKQQSPPYAWLKRWVVVKDGYMLWSSKHLKVQNEVNEQEKERWSKCVELIEITETELIESKKE